MTQTSAQYFDRVAGQWDDLRAGYFSPAVRDAAIQHAYLRPEMAVADVGAGTGFMAAGLAPLVQEVHLVDSSPAMLAEARRNLSAFRNVYFHEAEGLTLPFPDGSLDAVFANMYLHHCPDPLAAVKEMVRVLVPGGRLIITDLDTHPYSWLKEEMADEWQGFERGQVRQWLKAADLVNGIVACTGESCCSESGNPDVAEADRAAQISVFAAAGTRRLAMRAAVQKAYGDRARSGNSCCGQAPAGDSSNLKLVADSGCCGSSPQPAGQDFTFITGYTAEEKAAIPSEAGEFALGCGNPTAFAGLQPGETVLDIGSGGGVDAFLAASRVGPTGRVIGVDMTPAMLERARASALKAGIGNVEFRQGQAEDLPVADGTVDVILSNCVINLCEDKGQVFEEAFRVLKPGGRLEVSDMVTDRALPLEARQEEWAGCISGALPEREYLELVAGAGFDPVKARRSTVGGEMGGATVYSVTVSARKPGKVGAG